MWSRRKIGIFCCAAKLSLSSYCSTKWIFIQSQIILMLLKFKKRSFIGHKIYIIYNGELRRHLYCGKNACKSDEIGESKCVLYILYLKKLFLILLWNFCCYVWCFNVYCSHCETLKNLETFKTKQNYFL